jgi:hypothetical protein
MTVRFRLIFSACPALLSLFISLPKFPYPYLSMLFAALCE